METTFRIPKSELETNDCIASDESNKTSQRLSSDLQEAEADSTIHGFNTSNITVIEKQLNISADLDLTSNAKTASCEGSDSGVEVLEHQENCTLLRTLSTNSQDFIIVTPAQSCDSSIISCCSNYEEVYNVLARRNSSLFENYKIPNSEGTSEGGSESSSVVGSSSSKHSKRVNPSGSKKKTGINEVKSKNLTVPSRSRPPTMPRNAVLQKSKSKERQSLKSAKTPNEKNSNSRNKQVPELCLNLTKKDKTNPSSRGSSSSRTPITTPTDDGRWPSIHSRPAPLLGKMYNKGLFPLESPKLRTNQLAEPKFTNSAFAYATLPRRKKTKSVDVTPENKCPTSRETSITRTGSLLKRQTSREATPIKSLPPYPKRKISSKTRIYHETSIQTLLTSTDLEKAFSGLAVVPVNPQDIETCTKAVQADRTLEELAKLQERLQELENENANIRKEIDEQKKTICDTEQRLTEEQTEKNALKEELRQNTERVLALLGNNSAPKDESTSSDSLMVLETHYQKVSQIVIKQENEISHLNNLCRSLKRDLDKSLTAQRYLLQQQQETEADGLELQQFLQAEKGMLAEAHEEAEVKIKQLNALLLQKDKEIEGKQEECTHLVRISEQRRHENMGLQARFVALEARSRELLVHQGSHISGGAVALSSLISRLTGLVEELVSSYNISEQELDDVIFHNEAYTTSSSPDITPDNFKRSFKEKTTSPKGGSSFMSAVINAIKNAAAQTAFSGQKECSKDSIYTENSDSTEMLDSETEPCLMMEHVLEDVVIPDSHSHNMVSSGHGMLSSARLTHSESLNNLSQAILNRQISEQASISLTESLNASFTSDTGSLTELCTSVSLVDQVIEVDNLVTRLLKVLRIIQIENDDWINELQDERDGLSEQVGKQKDANKIVGKQLKDWENLGSHLKSEVKELMQQISRKNNEIDDLKTDLNQHRKEIERLNEDVCQLSTACSTSVLELKLRDDEVEQCIKQWEDTGDSPTMESLARLVTAQKDIPSLKEKLNEKEKQLHELTQEFLASRHVLSENLKEAVGEAKKQYDAIDSALEILHSIPTVIQQCPPLAKLQRDLEETSFQSASAMPLVIPPDCNANASLIQAVQNLGISSPINSPA